MGIIKRPERQNKILNRRIKMASSQTMDMTKGKPQSIILKFGIPLLFGLIFQQFYSVIDTYIVGKFLGERELAAVGSTGAVHFLIMGFCMGVCNGFSIPVAQCIGANDKKNLRVYISNMTWLSIAFSLIMTVVVSVFCKDILELMKTPTDIIDNAYDYIIIIFIGIPVTYLYNVLSGIMRALGDSKLPLIFLIISSVINVVLDLVTILVFDMGVKGPALATVVAQLISGVLCFITIIKKYDVVRVQKGEWGFSRIHAVNLCRMGIPMGLQYSITAIGSVILQSAVNGLGSQAVAAITAANKVTVFFWCPFDAMGATMATYAGQNIGAGKPDRVTQGVIKCAQIGFVYSIISFIILYFTGDFFNELFLQESGAEVLKQAKQILVWTAAFHFPLALVNIIRFAIQGIGYSEVAILAGVCEMIARAVAGFILVPELGFLGACVASPLAWIFADVFLIIAYIKIIKKVEKKMMG